MNIESVLDALKAAQAQPGGGDALRKAWTTGLGIVNYDLQAPALALYPWGKEITPLYYDIPVILSNKGDTATRWKAITAIDTGHMPMGLSEGNRSGLIATATASYTAAYVGLGMEDSVTFEADYAAEGFDDARARMVEGLLRSFILGKERYLLGGNSSVALTTTPTPAGTGQATLGALSNGTYYVGCVALTHDGWVRATVSAAGVVQQTVRSNADGSSDTINGGTAQPSAQSSGVSLSAGTSVQRVTADVTAVRGAVAYAWYLGSSAAHLYLQQITTINSVNFNTALVTTTQDFTTLTAADYSAESTYSFDGLLYLTGFKAGVNAYYAAQPTGTDGVGTPLTADGAGGIVEINTLIKDRWDNFRLTPDTIWFNSQEAINITNKVIAGGAAPVYRFVQDADRLASALIGGGYIGSLIDKVRGKQIQLRVHPEMPAGTLFADSKTIPYPLSGVGNVRQVKARRTIYQTEWPLRTRKYEAGVYDDSVLQHYFPPACGILTNIGNG